MGSKDSQALNWLGYVVLGVWIINGILVGFLITRVDAMINGQLYDFGLQFNHEWADPYWANLRLMYIGLAIPMVLSTLMLGLILKNIRGKIAAHFGKLTTKPDETIDEKSSSTTASDDEPLEMIVDTDKEETQQVIEVNQANETIKLEEALADKGEQATPPAEMVFLDQKQPETQSLIVDEPKAQETGESTQSGNICPNCNRQFKQPVVTLDYSTGKARLVNVCPNCRCNLEPTS